MIDRFIRNKIACFQAHIICPRVKTDIFAKCCVSIVKINAQSYYKKSEIKIKSTYNSKFQLKLKL